MRKVVLSLVALEVDTRGSTVQWQVGASIVETLKPSQAIA